MSKKKQRGFEMNFLEYKENIAKLTEASAAYYNSDVLLMDDITYDTLVRDVENAEREHPDWGPATPLHQVSGGTSTGGSILHNTPMLSLDNVFSEKDLKKFLLKIKESASEDIQFVVEPKLDGLALSIVYEEGKIKTIATRGDGKSGEDVTRIADLLVGVPRTITLKERVEVRGECFLSEDNFVNANEIRSSLGSRLFANPRNGVAGILRMKKADPRFQLSFLAYDGYVMEDIDLHFELLVSFEKLGFPVVPRFRSDNIEEVIRNVSEFQQLRIGYGYPTDGAVVKVDSAAVAKKLGNSFKAPKSAIAYKYPAQSRLTKLVGIRLSVGRSGAITPVAELDPVEVGGVVISSATLHNTNEVADKDLRINDMVWVQRAGEVVPEVVAPNIELRPENSIVWEGPQTCPRCGGDIDRTQKVWRCMRGRACGLVESLVYAASRDILDIETLGDATARLLVNNKIVKSFPDLYRLSYEDLRALPNFGDISANKLLEEIDKTRQYDWSYFVLAMGVRFIGRRARRVLADNFDSFEDFAQASEEKLASLAMFGTIKAKTIKEELMELQDTFEDLKQLGLLNPQVKAVKTHSIPDSDKIFAGERIVITGSFDAFTREELGKLIEERGGVVASGVSKNTTKVFLGEKAGSKAAKAAELGITTIKEEEIKSFLKL
jgi:DNA ligase (NAD+)